MELLVAAANDQSGQAVQVIVVLLLVVAACLAGLTIWYWRFTDPRRRVETEAELKSLPEESALPPVPAPISAVAAAEGPARVPAVTGQMPAVSVVQQVAPALIGSVNRSEPVHPRKPAVVVRHVPPPVRPPASAAVSSSREVLELSPNDSVRSDDTGGSVSPADLTAIGSEHSINQSVLGEAAKTGELNLTDAQWDHLAQAVLGAMGWDDLAPESSDIEARHGQPDAGDAAPSVAVCD